MYMGGFNGFSGQINNGFVPPAVNWRVGCDQAAEISTNIGSSGSVDFSTFTQGS